MSTIVTITFNPCIDKGITVPLLVPDKKLVCSITTVEPGGGGVNVARAITKLGGEACAIYPSGCCTGKHFGDLLQLEKVPVKVIEIGGETRENIILKDMATGQQYRFGMPGPILQEKEWHDCLQAINEFEDISYIVASGSLPPGVPANIYSRIAAIAKRKNARMVVDTSSEFLAHSIRDGVYLLKPNMEELSALTGKTVLTEAEAEESARDLIVCGYCEIVVVSMGAGGAMLVTKDETWRAIPPVVKPVSTVGAGDSMVAGVVLSLSNKKSFREVLHFGVACGTAATLHPGTGLCRTDDVMKILKDIRVYPLFQNIQPSNFLSKELSQ